MGMPGSQQTVQRLVDEHYVALYRYAQRLTGSPVAAECGLCLDYVALQTPDGQPWTEGKPVTLVVHVTSQAAVALPPRALAIVMQTDGDRTKCLDVPLKLVQSDAAGGLYAGLFFPFRPAEGDILLVAKGQTVALAIERGPLVDPDRLSAAKQLRLDLVLANGATLSGRASVELPEQHSRALDYLNATSAPFFELSTDESTHYVNRAHVLFARPRD